MHLILQKYSKFHSKKTFVPGLVASYITYIITNQSLFKTIICSQYYALRSFQYYYLYSFSMRVYCISILLRWGLPYINALCTLSYMFIYILISPTFIFDVILLAFNYNSFNRPMVLSQLEILYLFTSIHTHLCT